MQPNLRTSIVAGVFTAALMACGDETKLDERVVTGETPAPRYEEMATVFEPLSRTYKLRPEQQERRDALDMDAFQDEYGRYRDAIVTEGRPGDGEGGGAAPSATSPADGATGAPSTNGLRPRSQMDFAYLDRNGDGRLSVAEYAIWAVPIDPKVPRPDDKQPYLTADQANRTANSFYFYDQNDDGYIQPGEFAVFTATKSS